MIACTFLTLARHISKMACEKKLLKTSVLESTAVFKEDGVKTIPDCLRHYAETLNDKEAMVFVDYEGGREAVSWKEIFDRSQNTARSLKKLGVKEDELVAINLRPCPEWLYVFYGTMMMGATPVLISFTFKDGSDSIALMKKLEKCSALVMDPGFEEENWNVMKQLICSCRPYGIVKSDAMPYLRYLICHNDNGVMKNALKLLDLAKQHNTEDNLPEINEDRVAVVLQSSGSTGVPKLIVHTHKSIVSIRLISSASIVNDSVVYYNDRPFNWIGGFPINLMNGRKRVTVSGFCLPPADRIAAIVDIIQRERCTLCFALPPVLNKLVQKMPEMTENWPVQQIVTGGQPMTKIHAKAIGRVTPMLAISYACTEFLIVATSIVSSEKSFQEYRCGTILDIPKLMVKIVDNEGCVVPVNTKGEIYVHSPAVFKCYFNDPEKTAEALTPDGWYKTDDIGTITENGELFVYGRKSNIIVSGGMNVAPEILETVIASCPGVASVIIVPVPDYVFYHVLCACVITKPGSDLTEEQLRAYCADVYNDTLGQFTVLPKFYMFLDEFPETFTGKLSRPALTEMVVKQFGKFTKEV